MSRKNYEVTLTLKFGIEAAQDSSQEFVEKAIDEMMESVVYDFNGNAWIYGFYTEVDRKIKIKKIKDYIEIED